MARLRCQDYGFECKFVAEGTETAKVVDDFRKHTEDEHGIEYSKEALMQFIIRQG